MQDNLIVSIGMASWVSVPEEVEIETLQSREFGVFLMGERMIPSGIAGLGFGLGFTSQNVNSDATLEESNDGAFTYFSKIPDSISYCRNKISLNFLDALLEIRLHSQPNADRKRFKFNAGFKAGILVQSHVKFKDEDATYKQSLISHLNKYQYGLTTRFGYGNVAIGGYYSLLGIFKTDEGPDLIPYSISIFLTL